ncbi:hypothetical protein GCM10011378_30140 [Hymenobacter glacieicola]|uniref:DUF1735 domain-containing protein n=2 Tax=Hymenobacter glacieicola TaxID=1562124 RepID=A0ABQ1WZ05_9BACT|nr:hypothetical protein GCM10011378_30140 [Hymenobacter glacieicola]
MSCEKDDEVVMVMPKANIVFDDNIEKISADYKVNQPITLKIRVGNEATSVRVISNYTVAAGAKTKEFTLPVTNGVATFTVAANDLRNTSDGAVVGAGTAPASTRAANTFNLRVDALLAGGAYESRFYTLTVVQ